MRRLHLTEHELTKRESETPEKARNSESEEGEAVHLVSLTESSLEGDRAVLTPSYGCDFHDHGGHNVTSMTIAFE